MRPCLSRYAVVQQIRLQRVTGRGALILAPFRGYDDDGGLNEEGLRKDVGVWIDHRKAVIVVAGKAGEAIQRVPSKMEKHVRFAGGAQAVSAEDIRDRRFANHLEHICGGHVADS